MTEPEDESGEQEPAAWWEWPFVVALMPFVFARRTLERVASIDFGRPFRWVWQRVLLPPLRALGRVAALPWRGLVWLARQIRGPFDAVFAWSKTFVAAVWRAVRGALAWVSEFVMAPVRWIARGLSWAGRSIGAALGWLGRTLCAPARFVWSWLRRLLALAGRALSTAGRWVWSWVVRIARAVATPFVAAYRWCRRWLRALRDSALWTAARRVMLAPIRGAKALLRPAADSVRALGARARAALARARQRGQQLSERARASARRVLGRR